MYLQTPVINLGRGKIALALMLVTLAGTCFARFNKQIHLFILCVTREFLKKSGSISLVANNPYSTYTTFKNTTTTADFYQYGYNQNLLSLACC